MQAVQIDAQDIEVGDALAYERGPFVIRSITHNHEGDRIEFTGRDLSTGTTHTVSLHGNERVATFCQFETTIENDELAAITENLTDAERMFAETTRAYRAREIDDVEYLAARAVRDATKNLYDEIYAKAQGQ